MATIVSSTGSRALGGLPLWQAGIAAIIVTAVTNAIVYAVARAAETLPPSVVVNTPGGSEPITLLPVVFASAQGALGAAIAFALLRRVTARPVRNLWTVGGVVTLLSLIPVFMIPDAPGRMIATLVVMHLVAAVVSITMVTRLARPCPAPSPPRAAR